MTAPPSTSRSSTSRWRAAPASGAIATWASPYTTATYRLHVSGATPSSTVSAIRATGRDGALCDTLAVASDDTRGQLDDVERRMVVELQHDGRITTQEIARRVGISETTARKKLRRLIGE